MTSWIRGKIIAVSISVGERKNFRNSLSHDREHPGHGCIPGLGGRTCGIGFHLLVPQLAPGVVDCPGYLANQEQHR